MFFDGESFLKLKDESNPLESDIEIIAKPPGKRNKSLKMLPLRKSFICNSNTICYIS